MQIKEASLLSILLEFEISIKEKHYYLVFCNKTPKNNFVLKLSKNFFLLGNFLHFDLYLINIVHINIKQ